MTMRIDLPLPNHPSSSLSRSSRGTAGWAALLMALALLGCGGASQQKNARSSTAPETSPEVGRDVRVSQSRGLQGGVVVLWPHVVPRKAERSVLAERVQGTLSTITRELVVPQATDVRPAPEQRCEEEGCIASSVGAVVLRQDGECAVVATIAHPGTSEVFLLPVHGKVQLREQYVPFGQSPESSIVVRDYEDCGKIHRSFVRSRNSIKEAIRQTLVTPQAAATEKASASNASSTSND